jgi:chemotaxis protein MotB
MQGSTATTVTAGQNTSPGTGQQNAGNGVVQTDYNTVRAALADFAIEAGIDDRLDISRSNEGIVIRIGGSLLFDSGRAVLTPSSAELLKRIVTLTKPLPNRVRIEGHTDDVAPDGFLFRDNWSLSVARAKAVLDALVAGDIEPARLSVEGLAQYQPVVPNDSEESRARNRRVDLVILYPEVTVPAETPGATAAPQE